jgi:hypothetical protein
LTGEKTRGASITGGLRPNKVLADTAWPDTSGGRDPKNWMWNPRFYKAVFKTKVTYEAYPESQAEVDEIAVRIGYRGVLYDP